MSSIKYYIEKLHHEMVGLDKAYEVMNLYEVKRRVREILRISRSL